MAQYICKQFGIDFTKSQIKSLIGPYFCIDVIIGMSNDISGFMGTGAAIILILTLLNSLNNGDIFTGNNGNLFGNKNGNELLNNYVTTEGRFNITKEFTPTVEVDF